MSRKQRFLRMTVAVLTAGLLLFGASRLPRTTWTRVGQMMAVASVSLQQAENTAERLSAGLTRPTAHAAGVTAPSASSTPPAGGAEQRPMTEPTAVQTGGTVAPPSENGSGGKVVTQTVGGGENIGGIAVKNKSGVAADVTEALAAALPFSVEVGSREPQVLIYHTHTTEGYMPYDTGYYNAGDVPRNTSYTNTVTAVGDALEAALVAAGIAVIHDTTVHDYPQYRGAYERSEETVKKILEQYPSIKVTLDIHRDGLMANERDILKPTVTVNDKKAAQLMVVCGVLSTDELPHKHWKNNLSFAAKLQRSLSERYDRLARPLSLTAARYNQYLSSGSLLIEVGSEGNTLEEAAYSARLLGETLAAMWSE
ncbi:MAG: stage II sporulation protein P [Ruminococcaceae bacterium]|nr:stage II sporulation protein P [Oscillospiraceae bacterium]